MPRPIANIHQLRRAFCRCFLACLLLFSLPARAQETAADLPRGPAANVSTNVPVREIAPGMLAIGDVRLNRAHRTLSFPAVVNLTESLAEYLVVTTHGKIHESVLRTEAQPYQIHLGMLLLGAKGAGSREFPENPSDPLPGDAMTIEVHWTRDGQTMTVPGETLARHRTTQKAMAATKWVYTGSILYENTFLAQQEGSIVALYTDPVALVNFPGPDRDNDENWEPNPAALPELESLVHVVFRLEKKEETPAEDSKSPPDP